MSTAESRDLATAVLGRLASDADRLGRFLAETGLDPAGIRDAARSPGFLPAILDHVAADETLLLAVASELDVPPERVMAARRALSPEADG